MPSNDLTQTAKEVSNLKPFIFMQNERGKKGRRKTIVAIVAGRQLSFGVATCCKEDTFDSKIGLRLAQDRANNEPSFVFRLATNQNPRRAFKKFVNSIL